MAHLTAVTITKNEEAHIARALRSVQGLADEIIVVDAESTDRTVEIARRFTDKVFSRPWPGFGPQKNFALQRASGDWVLFVDADEEVTPQLANEIKKVIQQPPGQLQRHPEAQGRRISAPDDKILRFAQDDKINCYFVRIVTVFLGKPLRHLWGTNPRVLRRSAVTWDSRAVHEQVARPDGSTVRLGDPDAVLLREVLLHPSHYATLAAYRERRERYTTRDAEDMLETGRDRLGKPVGTPDASFLGTQRFLTERAAKQFLRLSIKKRGFLDGWQGWLWTWLSAEYEYMASKKYLALRRQRAEG